MKNLNLQMKISIVIVVLVTVVSSIFSISNFQTTKFEKESALTSLADFTGERLAKTVAAPLWDYEYDNVEEILLFEMEERSISGVEVKDKDGKSVKRFGRDSVGEPIVLKDEIAGDFLQVTKDIVKDENIIGTVELYLTKQFLKRELNRQLGNSILSTIILTFVLVIGLLIIIRQIVLKPVNRVIIFANELKKGNLSARLPESGDEIGRMSEELNAFSTSLQKALDTTNSVMSAVSGGDLTSDISEDLNGDLNILKSSINNTVSMLGQTISQIVTTTNAVDTGANEIASSAGDLADGAARQASSIEEISSSLTEFTSQTKKNSKNAQEANYLSEETLQTVVKGNDKMEQMLESITKIQRTSTDMASVLKVIDDIAFQTNLLALNAAVEAARAGQYGKGFAVVADEVRNLANRSAEAAHNISEMIDLSIKEVENGVSSTSEVATSLSEISEKVGKTNELIDAIAQSSKEQELGITEIDAGLHQVNEVVLRNSAISEETASASQELSSQSSHLKLLINHFEVQKEEEPNYYLD